MPRTLPPTLAVLLALLAATVAGAVAAPQADAAKPCYKQLIDDWYDGRIDRSYPIKCYREAIKHLPPDVKIYSSAQEDFERALQAAIRRNGGTAPSVVPPSDAGREVEPSEDPGDGEAGGGASGGPDEGSPPSDDEEGVLGAFEPANADSIPIPVLVLAGVAALLLMAAGAGFVAKRVQERRVPVVPVVPGSGDGPAPPAPPD